MQSEIFQASICYNIDDYGFQLMKNFSQYYNFEFGGFSIIKIITNKCLKYLTLHVMSLYNILFSPFKLNY